MTKLIVFYCMISMENENRIRSFVVSGLDRENNKQFKFGVLVNTKTYPFDDDMLERDIVSEGVEWGQYPYANNVSANVEEKNIDEGIAFYVY